MKWKPPLILDLNITSKKIQPLLLWNICGDGGGGDDSTSERDGYSADDDAVADEDSNNAAEVASVVVWGWCWHESDGNFIVLVRLRVIMTVIMKSLLKIFI